MTTGARTSSQRSFDDLGAPLFDVTFCVIDLETTGANATADRITEIAAAKFRGGECIATFQTLVDPGCPIPSSITLLTGISDDMVEDAPAIDLVLGSLVDFIADSVIVGHNIRFDLGFIREALARSGHKALTNRSIDTLGLARRLVRDEVPNCKLGTLATHLRLDHQPSHRALDDVLATADLLHLLIDRASGLGVMGLDDLVSLPKITNHPQATKLALTADLPRAPGVYLFKNRSGDVLYVGKATNLRGRVRSYFSGDSRRKVGPLLREAHSIDHIVCDHPLDAAVREIRLIHELSPHYNRQANTWSRYVYVRVAQADPFPQMSVVRKVRDDDCRYLGPLPSTSFARRVIEGIESVFVAQRCNPGSTSEDEPTVSDRLLAAIDVEPEILFDPLRRRMVSFATDQEFEAATGVREQAAALATALHRQRQVRSLRRAGRIVVEIPDQGGAEIHHGTLVHTWDSTGRSALREQDRTPAGPVAACVDDASKLDAPLPRESADEVLCIARWLETNAATIRLAHSDHGLRTPIHRIDRFTPSVA